VRAFIAIDLAPEIKERLQALVRDLRDTRADVRWVEAGGMHLTLKFLGEIDDGQTLRVREILASAASKHRPFALRLDGTGAFPNERSPRVLWVGCEAGPELAALQEEIEKALEPQGFGREARAFKPHLTLGRVKGLVRIDKAMAELAKHREGSYGGMTVGKIALFESVLRPQGAEYRVVSEAVLS